MNQSNVRFAFDASVPMTEVEATLRLALLAVESLHGEDRVRLDARVTLDRATRTCIINAASEVGRTLALVFGGYIRREFGDAAVNLVHAPVPGESAQAGAGA
jgi:hypothetical protein